MKNTIIGGVFRTQDEAIRAIEELHAMGYTKDEVSVFAKDSDDVDSIQNITGTEVTEKDSGRAENAAKGLGIGAGTGGIIGGITGIIASIGLLAIPGIGVLAAAGPLATALTGAAIGASGGGLVGALTGAGIPEKHAREYETHLNNGHIVVLVNADEAREERLYSNFSTNNSLNSHMYAEHVRTDNRVDKY